MFLILQKNPWVMIRREIRINFLLLRDQLSWLLPMLLLLPLTCPASQGFAPFGGPHHPAAKSLADECHWKVGINRTVICRWLLWHSSFFPEMHLYIFHKCLNVVSYSKLSVGVCGLVCAGFSVVWIFFIAVCLLWFFCGGFCFVEMQSGVGFLISVSSGLASWIHSAEVWVLNVSVKLGLNLLQFVNDFSGFLKLCME